ncbi:spermidine/putrescine ABC transporter permease [Spiroplasma helicoides]|uniref:Spermidine/putrescine ABC transporter permease n=1 Tax=Spiroplasma helicoides TaxID=216938 RepID=A0A1B3SJI9_9MOLU|nr:spermidine/putrescine ABC transporter permease [Spiroplasma helicoides]AOG60095.1 spermidine/putrescine ABC transporter permease [Spiroplasma helicoides]
MNNSENKDLIIQDENLVEDIIENKDNVDVETELEEIENIEAIGESEFVYQKPPLKERIANFKVVKALKGKIWPILLPFFIVMIFLVVLPLLGIIIFSIIDPSGNSMKFKANFENFVKFFNSQNIMAVLGLSLLYAFVASLICVVFAYPIAFIMAQLKNKMLAKNIWVLITLPIWISMILKIIGLNSLLSVVASSFLGTPGAIVLGMVYMFLPFAISPIYNAIENQDPSYYIAALDLKASKSKAFWHTIFRQSLPGVFAGFTLVIIQAATSLLIVRYMGDGKISLITSIIENYFFKGTDFGFGATIAVVLAILLFFIMGIMKLISNKFEVRGSRKWKSS